MAFLLAWGFVLLAVAVVVAVAVAVAVAVVKVVGAGLGFSFGLGYVCPISSGAPSLSDMVESPGSAGTSSSMAATRA